MIMGSPPLFGTDLPPHRYLRLPFLLCIVLGSTLLAYADTLLPWLPWLVPSSALGWLIPLVAVLWFFLPLMRQSTYPWKLWLPWVLWVAYYVLGAEAEHAFQRSVMLLVPLAVGMATSALRPSPALFFTLGKWIRWCTLAFLLVAGLATGFLENLQLGGPAGFAAGSMTAVILACWFAARYASGERRALIWWFLLALVPIIALTRMTMLAAAITLPLTLAPLKWRSRLAMLAVLAIAGLAVFQTERVQAKMFYNSRGTLEEAARGFLASLQGKEASVELGAFAQTGRVVVNAALLKGIAEAPWLGHGTNASEAMAMQYGQAHPHNDWLRLRYDYGLLGTLLFAASLVGQVRHAVRLARRVGGEAAICLYAGASAFLPMALLMLTDNVILYAPFFGNLQFMMLGLGYAATGMSRRHHPA